MTVIAPGATVGILGDGQLGRMMALAAAEMGYFVHVFGPDADNHAAQLSHRSTVDPYSDLAALEDFAKSDVVVTLEFANIPAETLDLLAASVPVRPHARLLEVTPDRLLEKRFINSLGIGTT